MAKIVCTIKTGKANREGDMGFIISTPKGIDDLQISIKNEVTETGRHNEKRRVIGVRRNKKNEIYKRYNISISNENR